MGPMGSRIAAVTCVLALAVGARSAAAETPALPPPDGAGAVSGSPAGRESGGESERRDDLIRPVDRRFHLALTVGLGLAYTFGEGPFKHELSADVCRWCGTNGFDTSVRSSLVWSDIELARTFSNVTGYYAAPIVALGGVALASHADGHGMSHWLDDGLIIAESAAIAGVLNYGIKAAFARERPFVHYMADADKPFTKHPQDNNQSFYSGHSTLAMSLAISSGTVARMRGYRLAPYLYGGGITLALATGYLRIAADKHWTSDVALGWATGAAIGYLVPHLLHKRRGKTEITPVVSASTVGVSMRW